MTCTWSSSGSSGSLFPEFCLFFCCTDAEKAARCSQEAPLLYGFAVHLRTGKLKGISLCLVTISLKGEAAGVWCWDPQTPWGSMQHVPRAQWKHRGGGNGEKRHHKERIVLACCPAMDSLLFTLSQDVFHRKKAANSWWIGHTALDLLLLYLHQQRFPPQHRSCAHWPQGCRISSALHASSKASRLSGLSVLDFKTWNGPMSFPWHSWTCSGGYPTLPQNRNPSRSWAAHLTSYGCPFAKFKTTQHLGTSAFCLRHAWSCKAAIEAWAEGSDQAKNRSTEGTLAVLLARISLCC